MAFQLYLSSHLRHLVIHACALCLRGAGEFRTHSPAVLVLWFTTLMVVPWDVCAPRSRADCRVQWTGCGRAGAHPEGSSAHLNVTIGAVPRVGVCRVRRLWWMDVPLLSLVFAGQLSFVSCRPGDRGATLAQLLLLTMLKLCIQQVHRLHLCQQPHRMRIMRC